jgi:hypothetical protein
VIKIPHPYEPANRIVLGKISLYTRFTKYLPNDPTKSLDPRRRSESTHVPSSHPVYGCQARSLAHTPRAYVHVGDPHVHARCAFTVTSAMMGSSFQVDSTVDVEEFMPIYPWRASERAGAGDMVRQLCRWSEDSRSSVQYMGRTPIADRSRGRCCLQKARM